MNPFAVRPSSPISERRAKGLVGPRLTVVFFGVSAEVLHACEPLARSLPFARAEAKHLYAACAALEAFASAILVVSTSIRPWDRDVIEEHASRVKAPVLWVGSDDVEEIVTSLESCATAVLRRGKAHT
jgi:hypothetical protein